MTPQQLQRREAAAERHDCALARFPLRQGVAFQRELRKVIHELKSIVAESSRGVYDPEEQARTLSWLASAYLDLAAGNEPSLLAQSAQCYVDAERWLDGIDAPLTKAKITFNFANTLRGQSQGVNVDLMGAAKRRYQNASAEFRRLGEHPFAEQADHYLHLLDAQLVLARQASGLGDNIGRLEEMKEELADAHMLKRDALADEFARMKGSDGAIAKALNDAVVAARSAVGAVEDNPELFEGGQRQLEELQQPVGQLVPGSK